MSTQYWLMKSEPSSYSIDNLKKDRQTFWDPQDHHYDPKSTPQKPLWYMVDVEFVEKFPKIISLTELKEHPGLTGMLVLKRAMRLSVQPVSKEHFNLITHWFK
ncbi:MAG: EVE domain-containing protein [Deltaproteobacteria bacterium]|nr:EVE domain-containing protein [Deltaproteobacteria bacterium]